MGNLENVKIVCTGFEVTAEAKENILIVFKKLLDEAPYGAFLEVHLEKVADGISGRIHISSLGGEFKASALEMTPQDAVDALFLTIRNQIVEWKTTRFADTSAAVLA
tara:strand:- start:14325 stop:14645 length:321 start_codon:yes stop_codon:yes gene_type:complete